MLDAPVMRLASRPLSAAGRLVARCGVSANAVTVAGFGFGVLACGAVAAGQFGAALALLALNRLCDGLDGAVARQTGPTDFGGFLDIVLDFVFYGGYVFAFAVSEPANSLAAAFLIFSFMGTGSSFLAFAIVAQKRGITTSARGQKSFYYLGGLTEGTETAAVFAAMALWPGAFPALAWIFGGLCWITTATRIYTVAVVAKETS